MSTNYPAIDSEWQHTNGNYYKVVVIANKYSENPRYPVVIVYKGQNGKVWSRLFSDWERSMKTVDPLESEGLEWTDDEKQEYSDY